jgi:hypothetical protein
MKVVTEMSRSAGVVVLDQSELALVHGNRRDRLIPRDTCSLM